MPVPLHATWTRAGPRTDGRVWLDPYDDGWQISTSGGRKAVKRGRAASILGGFGVVDIKSFRSWLQRSFTALPRPAPERLGG